jgi:hypothetical protein
MKNERSAYFLDKPSRKRPFITQGASNAPDRSKNLPTGLIALDLALPNA